MDGVSNALATVNGKRSALQASRSPSRAWPVGDGAGESPRFLLYSHDGPGLGHVRRNLVIAAALVERSPGASVLLATSAEHADSLGVPERVDLLRLPAIRKVENGRYAATAAHLRLGPDRVRERILAAAVESYGPSVLLADKHPLGVGGELRTALETAAGARRPGGARAARRPRHAATVRAEWTPARARARPRALRPRPRLRRQAVFDPLRRSASPPTSPP